MTRHLLVFALVLLTSFFPGAVFAQDAARPTLSNPNATSETCALYRYLCDVYGEKIFPQWLDDDQLRNVRDLDMFEMRRRGFTRWRNDLAQ